MKQTLKLLALGLLTVAVFTLAKTPSAHAATLTVATGTDETTTNSSCSLSEAIENINDQLPTNTDCAAGDGINDTISIPAGTITLIADLPVITESVIITGAGMGETVIDGDGQWGVFSNQPASSAATIVYKSLTVAAYRWFAVLSLSGNLTVEEFEVDGNGATFDTGPGSAGGAIVAQNPTDVAITVNYENVWIHDITADTQSFFVLGAVGGGNSGGSNEGSDINLTANNVTIENFTNTGAVLAFMGGWGVLNEGVGDGDFTGLLSNITISNITSENDSAAGIVVITIGQDKTSKMTVRNATIGELSGTSQNFVESGGIAAVSAGVTQGVSSRSEVIATNVVLFDNPSNCNFASLDSITGGDPGTQSITSTGGNLSDDTTCSPYFTHPTDQNNLTTLGTTLEALSDNGGFVPTRALKQGSPAIDSGVTIAGLTSDARLALRPQGTAFDSGAYESPFSKPAASVASLASTGSSQTSIMLITGAFSFAAAAYVLKKSVLGRR